MHQQGCASLRSSSSWHSCGQSERDGELLVRDSRELNLPRHDKCVSRAFDCSCMISVCVRDIPTESLVCCPAVVVRMCCEGVAFDVDALFIYCRAQEVQSKDLELERL